MKHVTNRAKGNASDSFERAESPGPRRTEGVTLRDVAKAAGVSVATASRVFNGKNTVRKDTRDRVLKAADELHYTVNTLAKSMMGNGPRLLAYITFARAGTQSDVIDGMEQVAIAHGAMFTASTVGGDVRQEHTLLRMYMQQRAVGVILGKSGDNSPEYIARIRQYHEDLLSIGSYLVLCRPEIPELPDVPTVAYEQTMAVRRALHNLVMIGHRRIAFIGDWDQDSACRRVAGYRRGLADDGIPEDPELIVRCPSSTEDGSRAAEQLLRRFDQHPEMRPTAIMTFADDIAIGVYRAARRLGLRIPDDLSVVGYDDIPFASDITPPLTTIHPSFRSVGQRAAELIFNQPAPDSPELHTTFESRFVLRASIAPPHID